MASTLTNLCKEVKSGSLDAKVVVDILNQYQLLPYTIGHTKNLLDVSLGRNTNASKVGDIIVSEECIRGDYKLCIAFLEFVLTIIQDQKYSDNSNAMLAALTYICNEIYTSYQIWTYRNIEDMERILCLCTEIFHQIVSSTKDNSSSRRDYSDLQIVCIINLSQNQAHKQLLDVIVEGKKSIKKKIDKFNLKDERSLSVTPVVNCIRQSLFIFNKLLIHSKFTKEFCDTASGQQPANHTPTLSQYQHGASSSSAPMTNIEKALFDTSIRPGLLQQLFSYIYQDQDCKTACQAVDLIKNIAKKFSMSLMACLGSEADRVCEFFLNNLGNKEANVDLEISILDLLSTCVKYQPGLIELFLNYRHDQEKSPNDKTKDDSSLRVVVNLLKDCREGKDETQKQLHSYLMKFILTFWQKNHSAIDQFNNAPDFWESVIDPLIKFLECDTNDRGETIGSNDKTQASKDRLNSYAMMILAREIFSLNSTTSSDRKISPQLKAGLDEISSKNFIGKYSTFVRRKYEHIGSNLGQSDDYNRVFTAWRDFLTSYSKYNASDIKEMVREQVIDDIMCCMKTELRLGEQLDKERIAAIGETLLLVWTRWMPKSAGGDSTFQSIHELLYLTDSCKDNLPFSFLLTFQSTLNLYLVRHRDYLIDSRKAFDLMVPALQLMQTSLRVMEKYLIDQGNQVLDYSYKPGIESRLCQASIMTLRFIIDVSRKNVNLWISYIQTNLKTDSMIQFLILLMNKRAGPEICLSLVELLLCLSTIKETADYLNKAAFLSQVNMIAVSAYERPYAHLSHLAAASHFITPKADANLSVGKATLTDKTDGKNNMSSQTTFSQPVDANSSNGAPTTTTNTISSVMSDATKIYLDNINSDHRWLPIYWHVTRLNISMMLTLSNDYMSTAIEFLSTHSIRICETFELLRTKPRSVNMEEALQLIYMIDMVLGHGPMWRKRSPQSYSAISDEIGKTAYTLATSALPPPTTVELKTDGSSSPTSIKPRDCLVYAKCCYNFSKYTEAERVLFQTKFGDKLGFINEAAQIYGKELSIFAFHLASLICLKTNRQSDSIDFALILFEDDSEHADIVAALRQNQA